MEMTYENAIKRLEEISALMEDTSRPLDEAMALFEEGTKLAAFCSERLDKAEQKIKELVKE